MPRRPGLDPATAAGGRFSRAYAAAVVRLRFAVVAGWLVVAAAAAAWLPGLSSGSDLGGFVGNSDPAIRAEITSVQIFGFPLLSRVALVQHNSNGLSVYAQTEAVLRALAVDQGSYPTPGLFGALPVPNTLGLFPGSRQHGTTVVTYLFTDPRRSLSDQYATARTFAAKHLSDPEDGYVGVSGSIPARDQQARLISGALPKLEIATVLAIALIVGLNFRSILAPIVTLGTAGIAVIVTLHVVGSVGRVLGIAIPAELEPLLVALLLGIVTDYAIFFLSGLRTNLARGQGRQEAAHTATAQFAPIIAAAGITVAAGTASLLAARSALYRGFGPSMALTILIGLVVAVTLVPALLALLGPAAFWPSRPAAGESAASEDMPGPGPSRLVNKTYRGGFITRLTQRPVAALVVVGCVGGLGLAALPVRSTDLGVGFVRSLPSSNPVAVAATAAQKGFAPGILSPTELLVQQPDIASRRPQLTRLGDLLRRQPGVAGVLGPTDVPSPRALGLLTARSGDAARYLVVLDSFPLGADAIGSYERLHAKLPSLLSASGLPNARIDAAGDTALAAGIVAKTRRDLVRIAIAAIAVNFVLLALFLQALVAPLYLLASSVLALAAALGCTTFLFEHIQGRSGLTFYVPFAAAVLLVALGSDYNIFAVGHVWEKARRMPLQAAIVEAVPESTRAITAAGITLAISFGLLAIVPLSSFRELGFAMFLGILLDAVIVRSLLVPALLSLVGPASGWPGRRIGTAEPEPEPAGAADAVAGTARE